MVVHASVASLLHGNRGALGEFGFSAVVVDDVLHHLKSAPSSVVMLPATNCVHQSLVSTMADRHPFVGIVAAVVDTTGHVTHQAIEAGATWVLNLLIPVESNRMGVSNRRELQLSLDR